MPAYLDPKLRRIKPQPPRLCYGTGMIAEHLNKKAEQKPAPEKPE